MTSNIWALVIGMFSAALGSPVILGVFQARARRRDHIEDRKYREDTARLLLESNARVARAAAAAQAETAMTLNTIHTLVNSNLTQAQTRELDATRAMLAAMREVVTLKEDRGVPIAQSTIDAVQQVEKRIGELARDLLYKKEQTAAAEEETAVTRAKNE
jgi:hypothetical protein